MVAGLVGLLLVVVGGLPAAADEALDELAATLGIEDQATDYILIVDTSLSMQEEGRWGRARDAVSGLADSLSPDDHVTLITFDDGAETVFGGDAPDTDTLLAALPDEPTGDQTDIGAAIDEGVAALTRDGASEVAAFVLLTDGELDAAPDSPFGRVGNPAWASLRTRADEAMTGRQVGAFALSLGPESDAGLLTEVFPNAQVATPDDIVAFLSGLTDEITRFRVGEVLAPDLEQPVTVALSEPVVEGSTATLTATWTSTTTNLPTTVSAVQLTPAVEGAALGMEPATLDLAPGQTETSTVTITVPPGTDATVALAATLTSPWQPQLAPLNLGQALAATSAPVQVTVADNAPPPSPSPTPSVAPEPEGVEQPSLMDGLPSWALPAALGALALLVVLALMVSAVRKRMPQLDGSLALVTPAGEVADEFLVTGPSSSTRRSGLTVKAKPGKGEAIRIDGRQGKERFAATLADGEQLRLPDGRTLRYTTERSRMLEMINSTGPAVPPGD
ncbi:vWA domain-containing protein [Tessaracoccus sp. G1721]